MENNQKYKIIPDSREKVNNLFAMYSMSGDPDDFSHLVNYDFSKTNILFYLPDKSIIESGEMELELKKFIDESSVISTSSITTYPKYEYF